MKLLIIRHGIAEDTKHFARSGQPDSVRPLTDKGIRCVKENALGLRRITEPLDMIASSPLLRARQTAEILAPLLGDPPVVEVPALQPGIGCEELGRWLDTQDTEALLAVVGHEPDLSSWISWLCSGHQESMVKLKKGGVCCLISKKGKGSGQFRLQWHLPPELLSRFGAY